MTTIDKNVKEEVKRKRTSLRDLHSGKGSLYVPANILPGYHLRWAGVSSGNPYRLHELMERGYGQLTEEQMKKIVGNIPTGLINQTRSESGSWITKQSGGITHYLMCISVEDHADIEREKKEIREEKDHQRMADIKSNPILTSADISVRGNSTKTWDS